MHSKRFEQLALDLLMKMGYGDRGAARRTGGSNDRGLDGYISEDVLGLRKIYVQAKRHNERNAISLKDAQRFTGALQEAGASKGVFITTAPRFSSSAKEHIEKIGMRYDTVIVCIDGPKLADLMIKYNVGVKDGPKYIVKKIDLNDYFEDEGL